MTSCIQLMKCRSAWLVRQALASSAALLTACPAYSVYNSFRSRYGRVTHSSATNHQRLLKAASCGTALPCSCEQAGQKCCWSCKPLSNMHTFRSRGCSMSQLKDFAYVPQVMVADINACKSLDAHGVVIGCLQPDGTVDIQQTGALVQAARVNVSHSGDCTTVSTANARCWQGLKKPCGMFVP